MDCKEIIPGSFLNSWMEVVNDKEIDCVEEKYAK